MIILSGSAITDVVPGGIGMSNTSIRTLLGSDLAPLLSLWNRALTLDPMSEERFVRTVLADPDYWPGEDSGFLVATREDQPVGFLRATIRRWPNDRLGLEPQYGWIPYLAVDPTHQRSGIGGMLLRAALEYFVRHGRRRAWVCGTPTSAPGSIVPGVDVDAYPAALELLRSHGFAIDQEGFSMSRSIVDFDTQAFRREAWKSGAEVEIESLQADRVQDLFIFLAHALPGAWNLAARTKVQRGGLDEMLIAFVAGQIVGYCQWEGEHFGPFGVAPAARNQRVGAKLFTAAVERIRLAGGRRVWFNWADGNAKRFYDRFGLQVTRRFVVLTKDLP